MGLEPDAEPVCRFLGQVAAPPPGPVIPIRAQTVRLTGSAVLGITRAVILGAEKGRAVERLIFYGAASGLVKVVFVGRAAPVRVIRGRAAVVRAVPVRVIRGRAVVVRTI